MNLLQVTRNLQRTITVSSDVISAQVFFPSDPGTTLIQDLRKLMAELISEINQIDQAIEVIEQTYNFS